jgi:predicted transcriptional regulator
MHKVFYTKFQRCMMTRHQIPALRFAALVVLTVALSGCMVPTPPSRGETGAQTLIAAAPETFLVKQVNVKVPKDLTVSEANTFKPNAAIVWHGDPKGDRYVQVEKIVSAAMEKGTAAFRAGRAVYVDVEVMRFHALTPKTRMTFGGVHELEYSLTLRDAKTGEVVQYLPLVSASVPGAGGERARLEEEAGRTEKVVIKEALIASIDRELTRVAARQSGKRQMGLTTRGLRAGAQDAAP